jgi:ATP-dependent Lon protease
MSEAKDKSKEPAEQEPAQKYGAEPFEIPVLPLRNTTLFPETMVPLAAGRPASVAAVEAALAGEEKLLACISIQPEKPEDQDTKSADLFQVGTLVMIKRMERVEDTLHLIVQGTDRIRVLNWTQEAPFYAPACKFFPSWKSKTTKRSKPQSATCRR